MPVNIDDNRVALVIPPLLRLAFRPFFLAGGLFSTIAMAWWIWVWQGLSEWQVYGGSVWWHGHEMVFGFGCVIVVGFLLTAVKNWTGTIGFRGWPLLGLFLLWLLGRLVLAFSFIMPASVASGSTLSAAVFWIAFIDMLFLPASAIAMFIPVYKVRQWRNMFFVPILLSFSLLNGVSHWAIVNNQPELANRVLHSAILILCLVIAIIGGRVIPMFTANGTGTAKATAIKWLDQMSITSLVLVVLCSLIGFSYFNRDVLVVVFFISALLNAYRFIRWGFWKCWNVPLLWSLHLGYAFLPLGLFAMACYFSGLLTNFGIALHVFSVGAVGSMILSMTSRVSLGHSGRSLQPPKLMSLAFMLIFLAAVFRVFVPEFLPGYYQPGIVAAGIAWILAYLIFCFCFGPMLLRKRIDGQPG